MEQEPLIDVAHQSLAEIVLRDTRAAAIFERFGLDYCCHGRQTVEEAAVARGLSATTVTAELAGLGAPLTEDATASDREDLDRLTHHIVTQHHEYVRQSCPTISGWLEKLAARHGSRHPELGQVRQTFLDLCDDLLTHMVKEENVLFPYIEDLARSNRDGVRPPATPFGTIRNPIRVMESDHELAGDLTARLRQLTHDYVAPEDACTTYRLCYAELARFERDLHQHVHLENNVLFPRAVDLEARLT